MRSAGFLALSMAVALVVALSSAASAATKNNYKILHTFTGGKDGGLVASGFTLDGNRNAYGMTFWGGTGAPCGYQSGCGVIFELSPETNDQWKEKVLLDFTDDTGSGGYSTNLLFNSSGKLFGSTSAIDYHAYIFELAPGGKGWKFNPIYDAGYGLLFDQAGNLYGDIGPGKYQYYGAIAELSPGSSGWNYTDLYDFCSRGECVQAAMLWSLPPSGMARATCLARLCTVASVSRLAGFPTAVGWSLK